MAPGLSLFDNDFSELSEALVRLAENPQTDLRLLTQQLELQLEELKGLLEHPPKNDAARAKLNSGTLEIDGTNYELNDVFRQQAAQLSDDLNLDEVLASKLLLQAQERGEEFDRPPLEASKILFHTRRRNALDAIRLILAYVTDDKIEPPTLVILEDAAQKLVSPGSGASASFSERCISTMASVRGSIQRLKEKERHAQTLGIPIELSVKEDLNVQLQFLTNQHDVLACIVYYLIKFKKAAVTDFRQLLQVAKSFDKYDVFLSHCVLPIFAFTGLLCGPESLISFHETIKLHKELLKDYKENPWPLRPTHAAVIVWWLSEFNGLCNDPPAAGVSALTELNYASDVYSPTKTALNDGGLEFLMALSSDVGAECPINSAKEDLIRFLQTRVPPLEDVAFLLEDFRLVMLSQLEVFVDSFISNMADLLKEIKTREEEDVLLGQRTYDYELERFFLIVHYVYYARQDVSMVFWSDPESNLHGFLTWASLRQTPFMAATFSYMVASLATGREAAESAHKFLLDEVTPGSTKNRRSTYISWDYIFKQFQSYLAQLDRRQQALAPNPNFKPPPPPGESTEPEPELSMMLDGFMRLASQIAIHCDAAREWLLNGTPSFELMKGLLDLLNKQASIQLWDTIFSTITALLTHKNIELSAKVWNCLDAWALGHSRSSSSSLTISTASGGAGSVAQTLPGNLEMIVSTAQVHPAEAFARLLAKLVEPPIEVAELRDALPFPENLGSSTRIPGIEPYVDLIMDTIFSNTTAKNLPRELPFPLDKQETAVEKVLRSQYKKFRPALQLACLDFIHMCLSGFNDDLLSIAHKNISIDEGLKASSLSIYTTLHPFGRVMEHILTEKCLNILFEILELGVEELNCSITPSDSVVRGVYYTTRILDLAIQMQPTYFRVVRPHINQNEAARRAAVTSNGFEELEKAVHYRLGMVVHLALYVGAAQTDIALAALGLLEKLNVSPHLIASTESTFGRHAPKNRLLGVVEQSPESSRIIFGFIHQWQRDDGSLGSPECKYPVKLAILQFLESALTARPNEYTLAHLLLGFGYDAKDGICLSTLPGGIGSGVSLLHHILTEAQDLEEAGDLTGYSRQACELKSACFSTLARLWKAPSTSSDILFVMRANKLLFSAFLQENLIDSNTVWEGAPFETSLRFFRAGSAAYSSFLRRRTALFEYSAIEIHQLTLQGASTMVQGYRSTLMGKTFVPEGALQNVHILDLLDFLELKQPETMQLPQLVWFGDCNVLAFQDDNSDGVPLFNLDVVAELLDIKKGELRANNAIPDDQEVLLDAEKKSILQHLFSENQLRLCRTARSSCLQSWATLVMVLLEDCEMEGLAKASFILQALQTILPKMEVYCTDDIESAQVLSALAHSLVSHLSFDASTLGTSRGNDLANDRLYQLFRVSLRCIQSPLTTPAVREDFYNIALRYLNGTATAYDKSAQTRRYSAQTIKASGDRLLDVICNDAYSGDASCKVASLLLLEALAALAGSDGSTYVTDTLVRQNFLVVLIDSIKAIGWDLQHTPAEGIPIVMKSFKAATGFLLRIAQTRHGAGRVVESGLFQALRECQLFSVDPDLGIDFSDLQSLEKYYDMLLDLLRVVITCVLSRGSQNKQTINAARNFLMENRNLAVTVFKRHTGIGGKGGIGDARLKNLVDSFVLLFSLTELLDSDGQV